MQRREFITLVASAAAWPTLARAEQSTMPVIGFLSNESPGGFTHLLTAFREGLSRSGFSEHRNVGIEYRWTEGHYDRIPELVSELVGRRVAVMALTGGLQPSLEAKARTSTIPIVFVSGGDPVQSGLVTSLNRPGANLTGVMLLTDPLHVKRLEMTRDLVGQHATIAVLVNPRNPNAELMTRDLEDAARSIGQRVEIVRAASEGEIEAAFAGIVRQQSPAVLVSPDVFFNSRRSQLVTLAARYRVPAVYQLREFVEAGGLMSYGANRAEAYRLAGTYVARILRGERPADLPVQQPTRFELVINLKAAKALGLTIPLTLQVSATDVIE
jgi:putative ABC transport system substrate-binding protein